MSLSQGNWPRVEGTDDVDDLLSPWPRRIVRTLRFTGGWSLSDLPRDLPGEMEPVEPEPAEPEEAEEQPTLPVDCNAHIEGEDVPDAA